MAYVAPLVGAWIETSFENTRQNRAKVAPLVGAWIETCRTNDTCGISKVAPLVGAWIETSIVTFTANPVNSRSSRRSVD